MGFTADAAKNDQVIQSEFYESTFAPKQLNQTSAMGGESILRTENAVQRVSGAFSKQMFMGKVW